MFASSNSFLKKAALPKRSSLLWYLLAHLNLVGPCDCNVGLNTKCTLVKVSENVEEDEPLSQTLVEIFKTKKNKTIVECVTKNSKWLICLTNQLQILHGTASKVCSGCLFFTPILLLLFEIQLPC